MEIGQVFNTPFEEGCVVTGAADADGNFMAKDSDGVECRFNEVMVMKVDDTRSDRDKLLQLALECFIDHRATGKWEFIARTWLEELTQK